ncbi:hypothetical protein VNO78_25479 [Psophocarpus tetragonolobus]|uniref:Uncharacterized protein n=1 Tax=Psophocarpus tetragonolobus TaxID=3891 RepID=A0AAN9XFD4_PSOTE
MSSTSNAHQRLTNSTWPIDHIATQRSRCQRWVTKREWRVGGSCIRCNDVGPTSFGLVNFRVRGKCENLRVRGNEFVSTFQKLKIFILSSSLAVSFAPLTMTELVFDHFAGDTVCFDGSD